MEATVQLTEEHPERFAAGPTERAREDRLLFKRYLERIPVVALDGEELYDFFVDEQDLRRRV